MNRRQLISHAISGAALSTLAGAIPTPAQTPKGSPAFLELKTWRMHNSDEGQPKRVADYLEHGLFPALTHAGARPIAALNVLIAPDGPYLVSIAQFPSLAAMQETAAKLDADPDHTKALQTLSARPGLPFVRVESALLRGFPGFPEAILPPGAGTRPTRIFEMRTYESQTPVTLKRKIAMFDGGESALFAHLGMRPIFFGETIVGPKQPCLVYMLSFDNLAEREKLWSAFGSSPEWKALSAPAELKDSEIVANISNVMLHPLPFSPLQ